MTKRPIRVGYLNEEGNWTVAATYSTYERADRAVERLSERYPHAAYDILDGALAAV